MDDEKNVVVGVPLPPPLREAVRTAAAEEGMTMATWIRRLIMQSMSYQRVTIGQKKSQKIQK